MMIHRSEIAEAQAHALAGANNQRIGARKTVPLMVSRLKSVISDGSGLLVPGTTFHSLRSMAKSGQSQGRFAVWGG